MYRRFGRCSWFRGDCCACDGIVSLVCDVCYVRSGKDLEAAAPAEGVASDAITKNLVCRPMCVCGGCLLCCCSTCLSDVCLNTIFMRPEDGRSSKEADALPIGTGKRVLRALLGGKCKFPPVNPHRQQLLVAMKTQRASRPCQKPAAKGMAKIKPAPKRKAAANGKKVKPKAGPLESSSILCACIHDLKCASSGMNVCVCVCAYCMKAEAKRKR